MLKQMIVQFRIQGHGSPEDLDRLVEIEERLDDALQRNRSGYVDGHDIGSGTMNLFLFVRTWKQGEWFMLEYLKHQSWATEAVLAKRLPNDAYKVLWPEGFRGEFAIL